MGGKNLLGFQLSSIIDQLFVFSQSFPAERIIDELFGIEICALCSIFCSLAALVLSRLFHPGWQGTTT